MGVNNKRLTLKTLKQKLLKLHLITYFGVHVWGIPPATCEFPGSSPLVGLSPRSR